MTTTTKNERFRIIYKLPEQTMNVFNHVVMNAPTAKEAQLMFQRAHPLRIIKEILPIDRKYID